MSIRKTLSLMRSSKPTSATVALDKLYDEVLSINSGSQAGPGAIDGADFEANEYEEKLILNALLIVSISFKSFTMEMLVEAVSIDNDMQCDEDLDEKQIAAFCSNLLLVNVLGYAEFTHQSVQDWLKRRFCSQADRLGWSFANGEDLFFMGQIQSGPFQTDRNLPSRVQPKRLLCHY